MTRVKLRILGESVIEIGEHTLTPNATHLFALLLYLGIERGRAVSRIELASMLFPQDQCESSAHNLRQLIYRMRRLGVEVENARSSVLLPHALVEGDAIEIIIGDRFPRALESGTRLDLLPHYSPPTAAMSRWLEEFRDRLYRQLLRRLGEDLQAARMRADWREVELAAKASLSLDPFNETATLLLAECLARTGSKQKAVTLLHQFEKEVGRSGDSLALPPRLLKRRISESVAPATASAEAPFIGRAQEMTRLAHAWHGSRHGACAIIAVGGEKLIGKSRLVSEFLAMVRIDGSGTVLHTRRAPADRHRPMSLFADICKQLICLPGAAGCSPQNIPFLERLSEAPKGSAWQRSDEHAAEFNKNSVHHAVVDLLDSVSSERALICHVDDAHHLDDASLELLTLIQRRLANSPLLVLLSGDCDERVRALGIPTLRLAPLDISEIHALANDLTSRSGARLHPDALARCVSLSGGNPGQVELLLGHAARAHGLEAVPPDLINLIDDQLSRLTVPSLHTLQACVVYGSECNPDVLRSLTGLDEYALLAALHELEERFLVLSSRSGMSARSALVEQRTQASTSNAVRSALHRRAARYLEALHEHATPSQAVAWSIASHWDNAGDGASAIRWRRACWRQLIAIGKPLDAVEGIRAHLASTVVPTERASLLDALIESLHAAADPEALTTAISERIALSEHVHDSHTTRSGLALDLAEAAISNYEDRTPFLSQLRLHHRSSSPDVSRRVRASRLLLIAADDAVDAQWAAEVFAINEELHPHDDDSVLAHLHTRLIYHSIFGDRQEALRTADTLSGMAHASERSWRTLTSELNISMARHLVDTLPSSYEQLEKRYEECRRAGMDAVALRFAARLTNLYFDNGQTDEATTWGNVSAMLARRLPPERLSADFLTSQIDLALFAGDFARAELLVDMVRFKAPPHTCSRLTQLSLFSRMRLAQFRGQDVANEELLTLLDWHERARAFGRHDDEMEVLWVALMRRRECERASELLREYLLHSRREARPPNFQMRVRTASDAAWSAFELMRNHGAPC